MPNEIFTDPETPADEWADIRMTDPEANEWDVDFVVAGGEVGYVDLQIRPELLASFIGCLLDDVDDDRAGAILADVADRTDIDLRDGIGTE
ncbi:hypothetical protein [Natrinema salinisoli]|uniref:hypothetical protein n=1 Tax=Natrinema salinisoli TaxID=2878535 RepID=UPI001CF01D53|nr:hypothetical protein [Natrinema salinisoli]